MMTTYASIGNVILATLSQQLVADCGRGFSYSALTRMVKFADEFPEKRIVAAMMPATATSWRCLREVHS